MNYESLLRKVHFSVRDWMANEIRAWCIHIELPQYADTLATKIANGQRLSKITEQDLINMIGADILKPLHTRKILKWSHDLLNRFDEYVEKERNLVVQYVVIYPIQKSSKANIKTSCELFESNLVIGSASYAQLKIDSSDISEKHATIIFEGSKYMVQDMSSRYGTYIKVQETELLASSQFLVGSHLVEIVKISQIGLGSSLVVTVSMKITAYELGNVYEQFRSFSLGYPLKQVFTIGRKTSSDLCFASDSELSGNHAEICVKDLRIFLKDSGSKNGVWVRLNSTQQDQYVLYHGMRIKFGFHSEFQVSFAKEKKSTRVQGISHHPTSSYCVRCRGHWHNAQLIPCSHSIYCTNCLKEEQKQSQPGIEINCPICSKKCWDFVEIFR